MKPKQLILALALTLGAATLAHAGDSVKIGYITDLSGVYSQCSELKQNTPKTA